MDIRTLFKLGMDRAIPELYTFMPPALNLGAGKKVIPGVRPLDYPEWDAEFQRIPCEDNSIGTIYAFHFLEHINNIVFVLQEIQRVLIVSGTCNIIVPYYNSQMQSQDLDHKRAFCEETWRVLFANKYYNKNRIEWKFDVGLNIIIGVAERNLALMTQLIRKE